MNKYLKRFSVIAILFLVSCSGASETKKENKRVTVKSPNIIFILTDDQGWNHVSHYSNPKIPDSKSDYFETPTHNVRPIIVTDGNK
jgi:hypothetical protein